MKNLQKAVLVLALGSFMTVGAQAAMSDLTGSPYVGAKVGKFMLDESGLDDPTAFGAYAGYNFTPNVGVEVEYVGSSDETVSGTDLDYNLKSYGVYGTYRYAFPTTNIYAKGKLGLAKTELEVDQANGSFTSDDSGLVGGVGVGYNVTPAVAVELEYDFLASDVDLLTIGGSYKF